MKEAQCLTCRYMKEACLFPARMYLEHAYLLYLLKYRGTEDCLCGKQEFSSDFFREGSVFLQHVLRNRHMMFCSSRCFRNLTRDLRGPYPCELKSGPFFFRRSPGRWSEVLQEAVLHSTGTLNQPEQVCLQSRLRMLCFRKTARCTTGVLPESYRNQFLAVRFLP